MRQPVSVIIPVYNAFEETARCLASVLMHSPVDVRVQVIDDASPDGELARALPRRLLRDRRVEVLRNGVNRGFVGTCNRGMLLLSGSDDVVLLNSDTVVTAGWLDKLQKAAFHRPQVGTVTPLTNNGVICSFPRFCEDNALVPGLTLDEFSHLVGKVARCEYPELPTAVGFCMYIRRAVIDAIGGFDEEAFGKGYGEENDFCCRARAAGFVDVLDDATFVYHSGSASFKAEKAELCRRNEQVLRARHPDYYERVAAFCGAQPLRAVHMRIHAALLERRLGKRRNVLHILHNGPYLERRHSVGGTELHVQELVGGLSGVQHWSLVPGIGTLHLSSHGYGADFEMVFPHDYPLRDLLRREYFDVVHLHHTIGFDADRLEEALRAHGNYAVSLHDYQQLCPRTYMLTPGERHCSGAECAAECSFEPSFIEAYRSRAKRLLEGAGRVICFSHSTISYFQKILAPRANYALIPHALDARSRCESDALPCSAWGTNSPFKVACIGYLPAHKGAKIVAEAAARAGEVAPIEWHVLGEIYVPVPPAVQVHGRYRRDEFEAKLRQIAPHVIVVPSLCPETYSMTVDEALRAGVPVIVSPVGAPAERVRADGSGWVMEEASAASLHLLLERIVGSPDEYDKIRARVSRLELPDRRAQLRRYEALYRELAPKAPSDPVALMRVVRPDVSAQIELLRRSRGRLSGAMNALMTTLDRSGWRGRAKRAAQALLPPEALAALRSLR